LFTQWSRGAVPVMSLLLVFIFTITSNVVFEPTTVWAEESEMSEEAVDESSATADSGGILGWIKGVTNAVNKMWGMENGSGVAMVVNGVFYLLLAAGALFIGKMVYNIARDVLAGKVDERYEKPSFRKK